MESDLSPQVADATLVDGEGGSYRAWTGAKSPVLVEAKVGAGILTLQPRGFALPHYSDCSKIGYVLQGTCTIGLISPDSSEERVVIVGTGYAIPVLIGTTSWWFNGGDSDVIILFLGATSTSYTPGIFNYFFLTGALGFLGGFSSEFISKIYQINKEESQILAKSQTAALVLKLDENISMPNKSDNKTKEYVFAVEADVTGETFPLLDKLGMSAKHVKLEPNSVLGPYCSKDGSYEMVYVVKGNGKVEMIGLNGQLVLDAKVEEGQLFVVPKFFIASLIADAQGLELFSVTTSSRPVVQFFSGDCSVWKAMPSPVLQASLNVDSKIAKILNPNA